MVSKEQQGVNSGYHQDIQELLWTFCVKMGKRMKLIKVERHIKEMELEERFGGLQSKGPWGTPVGEVLAETESSTQREAAKPHDLFLRAYFPFLYSFVNQAEKHLWLLSTEVTQNDWVVGGWGVRLPEQLFRKKMYVLGAEFWGPWLED